jgi:hypothetical protein
MATKAKSDNYDVCSVKITDLTLLLFSHVRGTTLPSTSTLRGLLVSSNSKQALTRSAMNKH